MPCNEFEFRWLPRTYNLASNQAQLSKLFVACLVIPFGVGGHVSAQVKSSISNADFRGRKTFPTGKIVVIRRLSSYFDLNCTKLSLINVMQETKQEERDIVAAVY